MSIMFLDGKTDLCGNETITLEKCKACKHFKYVKKSGKRITMVECGCDQVVKCLFGGNTMVDSDTIF